MAEFSQLCGHRNCIHFSDCSHATLNPWPHGRLCGWGSTDKFSPKKNVMSAVESLDALKGQANGR